MFWISWKFFLDHFKGGQSGLNQSKNFLDPKELMELLKSRDYERYGFSKKGTFLEKCNSQFWFII